MKAEAFRARKKGPNENQGCWPCQGCLILPSALRCCLQKMNCFLSTSDRPFLAGPKTCLTLPAAFLGSDIESRRADWRWFGVYTKQEECISFPYDFLTEKHLNLDIFIYKWDLEVYLFTFVSSLNGKGRKKDADFLCSIHFMKLL